MNVHDSAVSSEIAPPAYAWEWNSEAVMEGASAPSARSEPTAHWTNPM